MLHKNFPSKIHKRSILRFYATSSRSIRSKTLFKEHSGKSIKNSLQQVEWRFFSKVFARHPNDLRLLRLLCGLILRNANIFRVMLRLAVFLFLLDSALFFTNATSSLAGLSGPNGSWKDRCCNMNFCSISQWTRDDMPNLKNKFFRSSFSRGTICRTKVLV